MEKHDNVEEGHLPLSSSGGSHEQHISEKEKNHEDKKRKAEEDHSKSNDELDLHEEGGPETKKAKKDPNAQHPSPEDLVALEALASGYVPDMATAYSIASLSGSQQHPNNWDFTSGGGESGEQSQLTQAQLASMYQQYLAQQQEWYEQQRLQHELHSQGTDEQGLFVLLKQPEEIQRKAYKNENRRMTPNPLIVCIREFLSKEMKDQITKGVVSVTLVDAEGDKLPEHKENILESSKPLTLALDEHLSAEFPLKLTEASDGNMYRLLFTVQYVMKGVGNCEEKILSDGFTIYSNSKQKTKMGKRQSSQAAPRDKPTPLDLKPMRGPGFSDPPTEVWIKGNNFSKKATVMFGEKEAKVVEHTLTVLTVEAPVRDDVMNEEMEVEVVVTNKFGGKLFVGDKKLSYTYYPSK